MASAQRLAPVRSPTATFAETESREAHSTSIGTGSPTRATSRSCSSGNVDTVDDSSRSSSEYLASLPSLNRKETLRDNGVAAAEGHRREGRAQRRRAKGETRSSSSPGLIDYRRETASHLRALVELVQNQAQRNAPRKTRRDVYARASARTSTKVHRGRNTVTTVQFNSSPENVEKLSKSVFAMIDSLKPNGPSQADVDKVKEELTARARGRAEAERLLAVGKHRRARPGRRRHPAVCSRPV